eukprot:TRINITY_DN10071_c0_g1_i1.p2 TRINITY_DN10071_c0_g1~~TRINITY_DN10071_c0_g1_i1.p2  ORF type:complete len:193 (+),score=1.75 TRINITY_DN10071_c0_g1_i1:772-1350(+)
MASSSSAWDRMPHAAANWLRFFSYSLNFVCVFCLTGHACAYRPALRFQHTYVGNVAWLHLIALAKLTTKPELVAGQAFMAVDSPAENFWDFFEDYVVEAGYRMPRAWPYLPSWLAFAIAYITVWLCAFLRPLVVIEPTITPGAIVGVLHNQSYAGNKAAEVLGYSPLFSEDERRSRTMAWMKNDLLPRLKQP